MKTYASFVYITLKHLIEGAHVSVELFENTPVE